MKKLSIMASLVLALALIMGCAAPNASKPAPAPAQPAQAAPAASDAAPAPDGKVYTIRFAHTCADTHAYQKAGEKFKEIVEEKSGGRLLVDLYPSSQLGGERDLVEGLQVGTVDVCISSMGVAANFLEGLEIFSLPFMFTDSDHFRAVAFGDIGKEFISNIDGKNGLKVMGIFGSVFRIPFSHVGPLSTIEDFKGITMRNMEVPLHMDTYSALGSNPVAIPMSEQYMAYQMGTADAGENAIASIWSEKFYEVCPDVTLLPVISNSAIVLYSQKTFDALPADLQAIIEEAKDDMCLYADDYYLEAEAEGRRDMQSKGAVFHEVADITPFVDATKKVSEKYQQSIAPWAVALIPRIQALA